MARNSKACFLKVHALYGEMAEAYVMQSSLSDKQLQCFTKPFNKLFQEIAGEYVKSLPRKRSAVQTLKRKTLEERYHHLRQQLPYVDWSTGREMRGEMRRIKARLDK